MPTRYAMSDMPNATPSLGSLAGCTLVFLAGAIYAYNPSKDSISRRGGAGV